MANLFSKQLQAGIKKAGITTKEVAEHLGLNYHTYQYRVRNGGLDLNDYWRILALLNCSFEDLFPNPYDPKPKRISTSQTIPRIQDEPLPASTEKINPKLQEALLENLKNQEEKAKKRLNPLNPTVAKKEEVPVGAPSATAKKFKAIDIGIPNIDSPKPEIQEERDFYPPPPVIAVDLPPGFLDR